MFINRNLLWLFGLALLAAIVYYFSTIVAYILIAWVLSLLGRRLMVFFRQYLRVGRFGLNKTLAALLTVLTFYGSIAGLLFLFVPTIVQQARHLAGVDYQALGEKLRGPLSWLDLQMHTLGMLHSAESLTTKTQEIIGTWIRPALLGDFLGSFLATAGSMVAALVSITFILFFFLKDNSLFLEMIYALVPNELEEKVRNAADASSDVLTRYFGGLLTQILVFSSLISAALWLLGVPNALLIGAFGGILNIIPYLGPLLGIAFGWFITLSSNLETDFALVWPMMLIVAVVFLVVHLIDSNLISMLIFSKSVQAHPLEIFLVTLVAARLGGILGMVLGIPVYTVLRVIAYTFFNELKVVQRLTEHLTVVETPIVPDDSI